MIPPIIIIVEGGVVQAVYGLKGHHYVIVDHDEHATQDEHWVSHQEMEPYKDLTDKEVRAALRKEGISIPK